VQHFEQAVIGLIDHYGYAGLFVALLLGNFGVPIGSEIVLPAAGALTATGHLTNLWLTISIAVVGELAGGTVGYAIGRYGGVPIIERYGKYIHFTHERLTRLHGFFERWGTFAIFVCRFLPFIRGVSAIPAGIAEMNLALFYFWTFLGSLIFCTFLIMLGNTFGAHLDAVIPMLRKGGYFVLGAAVIAVAVTIVIMRLRARPVRAE
jgi:membrane protein DedA with SNARE-associated domain